MTSSRRILSVAAGMVAAGEIGALRRKGASDPAGIYEARGFTQRMVATPVGERVYHESGEGRPRVFLQAKHALGRWWGASRIVAGRVIRTEAYPEVVGV